MSQQIRPNPVLPHDVNGFLGRSPSFISVIEIIPRIAACDITVLLTGETGTGKEMCARMIHHLSSRSKGPFLPINCSSIPSELFESEMFGHEAGAFTDARHPRRGVIAEAEGGTLFLDEVDTLSAAAQVKLLRFLQDRQYKPLGNSRYKSANVRLLSASNQDLHRKVQEKSFREDLYFRLKVASLSIPPLRDRKEDILLLANHFLEISAKEYNKRIPTLSPDAIQKLLSYAWPGNVRELENILRQAIVLAEETIIDEQDIKLPGDLSPNIPVYKLPFNIAKQHIIRAFEREYLIEALAAAGGNISEAARLAKKDRRTFFGLLKKYGLSGAHIK